MYLTLLALSLRREDGVLIAKKCTAPCLQGVSTGFVLCGTSMYRTLLKGVWLAEIELNKINENKLRTHTLQARCGTFLTPEMVTTQVHCLSMTT